MPAGTFLTPVQLVVVASSADACTTERKDDGMATEQTIERAELILPHLVECAKTRSIITYGELAARIGVHHRVVRWPLGYIRDEICIPRDLPLITSLVINGDTQLPGDSWLPEGTSSLSPEEYEYEYKTYRDKVFAYDGWDALLKELGLPAIQEAAND